MQSETIGAIAAALAKAQGEIENAKFNRVNPHFKNKYADLTAIFDAVRAPLSKNELAVTQTIEVREAGMVLSTKLMHSSGEWLGSEYPLPMSARPQEFGSALTYAKRYSLASIVGVSADEDDDANAAQGASNGAARATLPKAKARDIYAKLQAEIDGAETVATLREWGEHARERISVLPVDWQDHLRLRYQERLVDLQQHEPRRPVTPAKQDADDLDIPPALDRRKPKQLAYDPRDEAGIAGIMEWIAGGLQVITDPAQLEAVWNDKIAPLVDQMLPPDAEQALTLYRERERELTQ